MEQRVARILALNSNQDVLEAIQGLFSGDGFLCDVGHVRDLRLGVKTVEQLFQGRTVDMILFDIAPPMAENWSYFRSFEKHPLVADVPLLLTTTNLASLQSLAEGRPSLEILLKPFDVELLLRLARVGTGQLRDDALWEHWFAGKRVQRPSSMS